MSKNLSFNPLLIFLDDFSTQKVSEILANFLLDLQLFLPRFVLANRPGFPFLGNDLLREADPGALQREVEPGARDHPESWSPFCHGGTPKSSISIGVCITSTYSNHPFRGTPLNFGNPQG